MQYRRESIESTMPDLPLRVVIKSSDDSTITADAHLHPEIELIRVLKGSLTIHFLTESITLLEGQLVFINSRVVHSTTLIKSISTKILVLQFNASTLNNQPIFTKHHLLLSFMNQDDCLFKLLSTETNPHHNKIAELTDHIYYELDHKEIGFKLSIKSFLYRILALLQRSHMLHQVAPLQPGVNDELLYKLEPIFDYTQDHYMEPISTEVITEIIHFTYSYFCRLFKKLTHKNYIDYLNYIRISAAEALLRT